MTKIGWNYGPEQVVFVDESACNRKTTYRDKAWSIRGRRAVRKAFFVRGQRYAEVYRNCTDHVPHHLTICRYSILPAISLNGIIAVDITEGSFNTSKFARFIDGLLNQMNEYPAPNSVIIMDNCRIHKSEAILEMIRERHAQS
jgi:hypothetical protein